MSDSIDQTGNSEVKAEVSAESAGNAEGAPTKIHTPPTDQSVDSATKVASQPVETSRKFKVKIDGAESEVDESELLKGYQSTRAAQKRFAEAAEMRKTAEQVIELLKTNPRAALTHPAVNADVKALAEAIIAEELEERLLDPKDRQMRELERKLQAAEAEKKRVLEERQAEQQQRLQEQYQERFTSTIDEALKISGLPKNKRTLNRMIDYLDEALDSGMELDAKDIARLAKEDYVNDVRLLFGEAPAETLAEMLGEEGVKKVRGYDVKRIVKEVAPAVPADQQPVPSDKTDKPSKVPMKQYFKDLHKKYGV